MNILPSFLRSLLLTILVSCMAPSLLLGCLFVCIYLLSYLPGLEGFTQFSCDRLLQFLIVFGTGDPWQGVLAIALTCGLVGALFDAYAFYQYHSIHHHS
jgi:hypothetical protein